LASWEKPGQIHGREDESLFLPGERLTSTLQPPWKRKLRYRFQIPTIEQLPYSEEPRLHANQER
jgi:hypothetical protein